MTYDPFLRAPCTCGHLGRHRGSAQPRERAAEIARNREERGASDILSTGALGNFEGLWREETGVFAFVGEWEWQRTNR